MAVNIPKWIFRQAIQPQVAAVRIPLEHAPYFREAADPFANLVQQVLKLFDCRRWSAAKATVATVRLNINTIKEQHMKVDIQVQGRTKTLNQSDCAS
jgi:hypothetical protein